MSATVTCDQCRQTAKLEGLVGWITLEHLQGALDTANYDSNTLPVDFCSIRCARGWICTHPNG